MDTGIPFFSEIEYLLLESIPLDTIMRVLILNIHSSDPISYVQPTVSYELTNFIQSFKYNFI